MVPPIEVNMSNYQKLGCLHQMFMKQAQKTPHKIAVVSSNQQITYRELDRYSDFLAAKLKGFGVGRNRVVGILMERCLEYTICYIAILKAGGAYLPIEVSYPTSLLNSVVDDSNPVIICTKSAFLDRLSEYKCRTIVLDDFMKIDYNEKMNIKFVSDPCDLDDMAYTVYSSGTTGKPKGIQCPHRGSVFSYTWRHLAYPYEEGEREACNIFFVWEMLRPLLKGATMYIIPDTVIYDPKLLLQFIQSNQITRMMFTPSLLQAVFDTPGLHIQNSFKSIRQIWLCGEVVTTRLRNRVAKLIPWVQLLNLYSVSECHDIAVSDLTGLEEYESNTCCTVGKIFQGVHVVILDEQQKEVPHGSSGEIYVGGPTLAIGYLNNPELNCHKFIKTPTALENKVGKRLYKTGDWGFLSSDGSLQVNGRCDTMVKIRGYTVELKAIEAALLDIDEVKMATVLTIGDEGSDKILVAYIVLFETTSPDESVVSLRELLKLKLPFYMIPSQFVYLEDIPLQSTTGKIDKNHLETIAINGHQINHIDLNNYYNDFYERKVAQIWLDVLKYYCLYPDENFFDLGGHSLSAALVINCVNQLFNTNLSTFDLYANPTISSLCNKLKTGKDIKIKMDIKRELEENKVKETLPEIKIRSFWQSLKYSKLRKGSVLLTGATGFLGSFILRDLLTSTELTVYCLARPNENNTAQERVKNVITKFGLKQEYFQRVVTISGDVSLSQFGLNEVEYTTLSYDIDFVIHAAANVNLTLPYSALYRANVIGTKNIVAFCMKEKLKALHYISTNGVFPSNGSNFSETSEMNEFAEKLLTGYGQSKWVAEQIVASASVLGLPAIISRCGNIGGSISTTQWNENDSNFLKILAIVLTSSAPHNSWNIELTLVDFVARIVVKMLQDIEETSGKVFHIVNNQRMKSSCFNELLQDEGYDIQFTSFEDWKNKVKGKAQIDHPVLYNYFDLVLKDEENLKEDAEFSQINLIKFLKKHVLEYPITDKQLFTLYLHSFRQLIPALSALPGGISPLKKVAFVTGASSGIGYAIAEELARNGIKVVLVARSLDKLIQLRNKIRKNGGDVFVLQLDVTKEKEVFKGVDEAIASVGPVDILVNAAGVMSYCKMANGELGDWNEMLKVNCGGFLNCLAAILPKMVERKSGHIINITSDGGKKTFDGLAVYCGSKFFVEAVSEATRREVVNSGVKITCIQPGDVDTGLHFKSKDKQTMKECIFDIPFMKPKDIADTVLFALNAPSNVAINEILVEPALGPI